MTRSNFSSATRAKNRQQYMYLKTKGDNGVKDQTEVAQILANYFPNAALSMGGDHVNNFTEDDHSDHSSVKTI